MPRLARIPPNPQLLPVTQTTPGHYGINLEQDGALLPPDWCTEANNCVLDSDGRISARGGFQTQTTTPIAFAIRTLFEQRTATGTSTNIVAWNGGISTSVLDPAGSDISGTVGDANGSWHFVNFNNKCIGFQAGQNAIVRTTGTFANVIASDGTAPQGGVGHAAYGRIWQMNTDGQTLQYSGLLREDQWATGGAGQISMQNIWTQGTDEVIAVTSFNHNIVVFGRRHIIFLGSVTGATSGFLGLDVTTMGVVDVIEGTGCISQHTVQRISDTDLLWVSPTGVQSMQRLIVQRSRPTVTVTKYQRTAFISDIQAETEDNIRTVYSPTYGYYLVSFPSVPRVWCIDTRHPFQDQIGDNCLPVTRWQLVQNIGVTAMYETTGRTLYTSAVTVGSVAKYLQSYSDGGSLFQVTFQTPWLDLGQDYASRLKILKRLGALVLVRNTTVVNFKWGIDFSTVTRSDSATAVGGTSAEWGLAEWNIGEWSGGSLLQLLRITAGGSGQYFRLTLTATVNGDFAIQQTSIIAKIGVLVG